MNWQELIGRSAPDELAGLLLSHLDWDSEERLLPLESRDGERLYDYFYGLAWKELDRLELPRSEWQPIASSPLFLSERALEEQGRVGEAAALYALSHDIELENPGDLARYDGLFLRFKLGHALLLLNKDDEDNVRRCEELAHRTVSLLNRLSTSQEIPLPLFRYLLFKLQRWRAERQKELRQARRAVETFRAAWREADDPDNRIDCLVCAVSILETLEELQEAYRLLLQGRYDVLQAQDEVARRLWGLQLGSLQLKLGGRLDAIEGQLDPADQSMARVTGRVLETDVFSADDVADVESFIGVDGPGTALQKPVELRHRRLVALAMFAFNAKNPHRAEQLLADAEKLETGPEHDRLRLARRILLARGHSQLGSAAMAVREFASLLKESERLLDSDEQLIFLGNFLVALAKDETSVDTETTVDLVDRLMSLYGGQLAAQPGIPARRRVREMKQQTIESAIAALLSTAERAGVVSPVGQRMLIRAWSVLMQVRNPELRTAPSVTSAPKDEVLCDLEEAFHTALRGSFNGYPTGDWKNLLKDLWEHEISTAAVPWTGGDLHPELPGNGIAVAFFQFRALLVDRPLLILIAQAGRLRMRIAQQAERDLLTPLVRWGERLERSSGSPAARHLSGEEEPQETEAGELSAVVAEELPDLFSDVMSEPTAGSWTIFPDGLLHQIPIEMLPCRPSLGRVLGESFPMRLCLRSSVLEEWDRRLDLSRGWLGLGGAPRLGNEDNLPNAVVEIESLRTHFAERGFPATGLLAAEAHAGNLAAKLESLHPAVLHFAVHGYSDDEYPEACALILAPDPTCVGRELLPFRKIRELPLTGVELVVLSACSSLAGRSGKSAGIEGLAWAFLQAGAGQVIATRYEIEDAAACRLMQVLYRHLFEAPVAEALRRMREECLREPQIGPREVGAWSLWS